MLTAKEARKLTDSFNDRKRAKEYVENLLVYVKGHALEGEDSLLFFIDCIELEDFIVQEFKKLGYTIKSSNLCYEHNPLYKISW